MTEATKELELHELHEVAASLAPDGVCHIAVGVDDVLCLHDGDGVTAVHIDDWPAADIGRLCRYCGQGRCGKCATIAAEMLLTPEDYTVRDFRREA